jgi:hypothetical protein
VIGVVVAVAAPTPPYSFTGDEVSVAKAAIRAGAVLVILGFAGFSGWALPRGARTASAIGGTGALVTVAALQGTWSDEADHVAGLVAVLLATAVVGTAIWVALRGTVERRASDSRLRTVLTHVCVLLVALLAVLPVEYPALRGGWWPNLNDVLQLGYFLPILLRLLLLVVAIGLMAATKRTDDWSYWGLVFVAVALLLRADQVQAGVAWSWVVGVFMVRFVLLPRQPEGRPIVPGDEQGRAAAIKGVVGSLKAARLTRDTQAGLRGKITAGDLDPDESDKFVAKVKEALAGGHEIDEDAQLDATAWANEDSPWKRAYLGGIVAGSIGVVFTFATLVQSLADVDRPAGYDTSSVVLVTILSFRFPLYGLAFGFLYPRIPGLTGMARALRLLAVLAVAETLALLVPSPDADLTGAITLRLVQLVTVCAVLGVGADLMTLRAAGEGGRQLPDLYRSNRVVLWSSGLLIATATTVATAMLGSAASLLLESLLPASPEPPPPVTTVTSTDGPSGERVETGTVTTDGEN